jgi:betaine-aldehyde dehydrogenase
LRAHFDEVVELLTMEEGKPVPENEEEVEWTIGTMDYYAEMARNYRGRVLPPSERSQFNFVIKDHTGWRPVSSPLTSPAANDLKVAPARPPVTPSLSNHPTIPPSPEPG